MRSPDRKIADKFGSNHKVILAGLGGSLLVLCLLGFFWFYQGGFPADGARSKSDSPRVSNVTSSLTPGAPSLDESQSDEAEDEIPGSAASAALESNPVLDPEKYKVPLEKLSNYEDHRATIVQFSGEQRSLIEQFLADLPEVKNFLEAFPKDQDASLYLAQMDSALSLVTELYAEAFNSDNRSALSEVRSVAESMTSDSVFTDPNMSQSERQIRAGMMAQLGYRISSLDPSWLGAMESRLVSEEGRALIQNIRSMQENNLLDSAQEGR